MRNFESVLMLIALLFGVFCVLVDDANATPFLWVDTVNGSDTSANPYQPNQPLRTYARAIALGADGDTIGVKVKPGSAAPSADEAYIIMSRKQDKVYGNSKREIIAGHGEVPVANTVESTDAGIKITTTYVWETFISPNGSQAERIIDVIVTTEDF